MQKNAILRLKDISISFGDNQVIHNISYGLNKNEVLGIVGESGSGKSVSSLAILGLLPRRISKITSGSIIYEDEDLTQLSSKAFQRIRGNKIAMIFQEPMSSLNPSMSCGKQVQEILLQHTSLSKENAKEAEAYSSSLQDNATDSDISSDPAQNSKDPLWINIETNR